MKIKEPPYTAEEERDFYRRNAGGPVAMTSMTRGRGVVSGIVGDLDWHVGSRRSWIIAQELRWFKAWDALADDDSGD
jgi:hypothetical protein